MKGLHTVVFMVIVLVTAIAVWQFWPNPENLPDNASADLPRRNVSPQSPYLPNPEPPPGSTSASAPASQIAPLDNDLPGGPYDDEVAYRYGDFVPVTEYRWNCQPGIYYISPQLFDTIEKCERRFEIDHPYALFTDEQLQQIAPTDGEAAFILAHRQLIDLPPGHKPDIESGLNNVMSAIIRGGDRQAFGLLFDPTIFSPYNDSHSYMVWSYVGIDLGLLSEPQIDQFHRAEATYTPDKLRSIMDEAQQISDLLRRQRLIVMGTEFKEENTTQNP